MSVKWRRKFYLEWFAPVEFRRRSMIDADGWHRTNRINIPGIKTTEKSCLWFQERIPDFLIVFDSMCFLIFSFFSLSIIFFHERKLKISYKKENFPLDLRNFNNFFICLIIRVCMFNRSWSTEHRYFNDRRCRYINKSANIEQAKIRFRNLAILFQKRWKHWLIWDGVWCVN